MILDKAELTQHFGDIWVAHQAGFTTLLTECRRCMGNDLDSVLIMSIIGGRTLSASRVSGVAYDEFLKGRRSGKQLSGTNVQSIADSTGIPRETVRRKVKQLIDHGWVRRGTNRNLVATEKAIVDLGPATEATFDYILALVNTVTAAEQAAPKAQET